MSENMLTMRRGRECGLECGSAFGVGCCPRTEVIYPLGRPVPLTLGTPLYLPF